MVALLEKGVIDAAFGCWSAAALMRLSQFFGTSVSLLRITTFLPSANRKPSFTDATKP